MLRNTPMPKFSSTPASMAPAISPGIRRTMGSIQPKTPQMMVSRAASMKAPTAWSKGTPARPVTSSAAPGVDQAKTTGRPVRRLTRAPPRPRARQMEPSQEPIRAVSRPPAWPACTISTAVPLKLTMTATSPAMTAEADRSWAAGRRGAQSAEDCSGPLMRGHR